MKWLLLLISLPVCAQQITFSKTFPGSMPAYMEVRIDEAGNVEYREDVKDDSPLKFQLSESDRAAILALAEKLGYFNRPLESPAKVAKMGMKMFRYEKGAEHHEISFNYSEDLDAQALHDWFERIAETEADRIDLERTAKFDKIGVENSLLRLEVSWDKKRLVSPQQMLPILDRIVKNESYMHMARTRAANLADRIRALK
jgi:hypothetical protein